ncbi:uncharacterized protein Z519_06084 [Cladophialophora bantiana CBS 173.52]|uniref:Cytochrome b561 domain-containing protein n=1 Tax=Cladophialophora bantiana (strain ATCC 10958 / CBS 173.52 / CDC B-1940 / NIH 8579) TaxID=1442370 RepID=A0A0D2I9N6_CLAB1|nr:uncharacterized protein Z519_06084 [Cladophialophora bantiana CBS 173.52]KIW93479.1 hypothetical protein Z519_06084 [Cladophialophora bantiana CBS 173.52]
MSARICMYLALTVFATIICARDADGDDGDRDESGADRGEGGSDSHPAYYHKVVIAHAALASVSWVIFFPLGAVLMRLLAGQKTTRIHAAIQVFATTIYTASVGMGIWMAQITEDLDSYHAIIGLVIFAVIWLQIVAALVHHLALFPKYRRRTTLAVVHIWLGRILITLGMINGGLGLKLSEDAERGEYIAYGVVSGVVWLVYVLLITYYEIRAPRKSLEERGKSREKRVFEHDSDNSSRNRSL